jgi:hypothetical protein
METSDVSRPHSMVILAVDKSRVVKKSISCRFFCSSSIFYFFCLKPRKKGMENPCKSNTFYNPDSSCSIATLVAINIMQYVIFLSIEKSQIPFFWFSCCFLSDQRVISGEPWRIFISRWILKISSILCGTQVDIWCNTILNNLLKEYKSYLRTDSNIKFHHFSSGNLAKKSRWAVFYSH